MFALMRLLFSVALAVFCAYVCECKCDCGSQPSAAAKKGAAPTSAEVGMMPREPKAPVFGQLDPAEAEELRPESTMYMELAHKVCVHVCGICCAYAYFVF